MPQSGNLGREAALVRSWSAQTSSEGGATPPFQLRLGLQHGGQIFLFFFFPKRSRKSGLFHKISPFLNAARMYKARCGPTKICLRVTIRLLPPLASCLLGSGSARPFHASLPAQLSLLETPVFCCSVRAHFCSFWNRRLTPHFLSEACPEPPYRGLTVYALLLHSPLPPRLVTSPPQVVLCPRS